MSFFDPIIKWIPKKIRGDVEIRDTSKEKDPTLIEDSPYAGIRPGEALKVPEIKKPLRKKEEEIEILAAGETPIRNNFETIDQEIMDTFINNIYQIEEDLDYIDEEIDKRLDSLEIPYDAKKSVLLYKAHHCPDCGNPSAPNVLTYKDFTMKKIFKSKFDARMVKNSVDTDTIGTNASPQDVLSNQEIRMRDMELDVLAIVWRQICTWVLEFLYGLVSWMSNKPIIKVLPKAIRNGIKSLRNKNKFNVISPEIEAKLSADDVREASDRSTILDVADYQSKIINEEASLDDIFGKNSFIAGMFCVRHEQDFNNYSYPIIQGSPYEGWLLMKDVNEKQRNSVTKIRECAGVMIPDGYTTVNGKRFNNTLPEDYLKARRDGKGPGASFVKGMVDVMKRMNKTYINKAKKILTNWWEDPQTLCCILQNLFAMNKISGGIDTKGQEVLLGIRAILELYRTSQSWKWRDANQKLSNIIKDLVEFVIMKLLSSYITLIKNKILEEIYNQEFLKNALTKDAKCLPWNEMILTVRDYLKRLLEEITAYFASFLEGLEAVNSQSYIFLEEIEKSLQVDKWIEIIDKILEFSYIWDKCIDGIKDTGGQSVNAGDISGEQDSRETVANQGGSTSKPIIPTVDLEEFNEETEKAGKITPENTIQNLQKTPTIYSDRSIEGLNIGKPGFKKILSNEEQREIRESITGKKAFQPWKISEPGMRILLTNFMGLSVEDATRVLENKGENCCENVLSDEELKKIRDSLLK